MLISGREACGVLGGIGITTRAARRVLSSGLAGDPIQARGANLFEEERVRALARRSPLPWPMVDEVCPAGIFIARREVDVRAPRQAQLEDLADGWSVSVWRWLAMSIQIQHHGSLPLVATISGFVAFGADIVGLRGGSRLLLEQPGPWFSALEDHRLPTGPGRPWILHLDERQDLFPATGCGRSVTTPTSTCADSDVTDQ